MNYTAPDGTTLTHTGAYALRYAVLVRDRGFMPWSFYGTSRTYQGAWRKLSEARRRGGFDDTNSTIVEGEECPYCAPDELCALHIGSTRARAREERK